MLSGVNEYIKMYFLPKTVKLLLVAVALAVAVAVAVAVE